MAEAKVQPLPWVHMDSDRGDRNRMSSLPSHSTSTASDSMSNCPPFNTTHRHPLFTSSRAALFIASEDAPQRAESAKALLAAAAEPKKLLLVPGAAHNLVLFDEHPEAKAAMLDWLAGQLGATPVTTMSAAPAGEPTPAVSPTPLPKQ